MNIETLKQIGGNEWQQNGMHRIYFNYETICKIVGFNGGKKWGDEDITYGIAQEIKQDLKGTKIWFDVATGEFNFKMSGFTSGAPYRIKKAIEAIKAAAAQAETPAAPQVTVSAEIETTAPDVYVPCEMTTTGQAIKMLENMTDEQYQAWNERELKRQKYDNPKPEYAGGPTYYDENTQIWDD